MAIVYFDKIAELRVLAEFSDGLDLLEGSLITGLPLGGQEVAPELGGQPLERLFVLPWPNCA